MERLFLCYICILTKGVLQIVYYIHMYTFFRNKVITNNETGLRRGYLDLWTISAVKTDNLHDHLKLNIYYSAGL